MEDHVVDLGVALETLSGVEGGVTQSKVIARLITDDEDEQHRLREHELKAFRKCREGILHRGETPSDMADMAQLAERLTREAILGRIRN